MAEQMSDESFLDEEDDLLNFAEDADLFGDSSPDSLPDFANAENRKLAEEMRKQELYLQELSTEYHDHEQRVAVMIEHLKNVDTELLHTQALLTSKKKEAETEQHLIKLSRKETEKLTDEVKKFQESIFDFQHKLNVMNNEIFNAKEKIEDFRISMEWNEDELEQWAMAKQQKEEDHLALESYKRQDEAKIVSMNVQITKLSKTLQEVRQKLDKELAETRACQIELDNAALDLHKVHEERVEMNQRFEATSRRIRDKDVEIRQVMESIEALREEQDQKDALLQRHKQRIAEEKKKRRKKQLVIVAQKNKRRKAEEDLAQKQETLKQFGDELFLKESELQKLQLDLIKSKKEVISIKGTLRGREKQIGKMETSVKSIEESVEKAKTEKHTAEEIIKEVDDQYQRALEDLDEMRKQEAELKREKLKQTELVHQKRQEESRLFSEINGAKASNKNLKDKIKDFDSVSLKQSEILYGYDFQIQILERKVERAGGKRTQKETTELNSRIDALEAKVSEEEKQEKTLKKQIRRLQDAIRHLKRDKEAIETAVRDCNSEIAEKKLENESINAEISQIEDRERETTVSHNELNLEVQRLKNRLLEIADDCFCLDNKKVHMELTMQERRAEISLVHDMEKARIKVEKEEISTLNKEIKERKSHVHALKCRHNCVKGSTAGSSENSQAYYIIKVAQERAEVEKHGDELNENIQTAEVEIKKLDNTLRHLSMKNSTLRKSLTAVPMDCPEAKMKDRLQTQLNGFADELYKKKSGLRDLHNGLQVHERTLQDLETQGALVKEKCQHKEYERNEIGESLQSRLKLYQKKVDAYQSIVQNWRDQCQKDERTPEEVEVDVRNLKRETLAIMNLMMDLTNEFPQFEETVRQLFRHHDVDYRPSRSRGRSTPTPRPLSRSSSTKLPRINTATSAGSESSQASIVNLTFEGRSSR